MTENKKRAATRMVPAPSHGIIPERDFNGAPCWGGAESGD